MTGSPIISVDRILRVHIVAKLLGCSGRTVRRHIQNQRIKAARIGRRAWGIRLSDLDRGPGSSGGSNAGN
jgi:excisionase family DNA binding protein